MMKKVVTLVAVGGVILGLLGKMTFNLITEDIDCAGNNCTYLNYGQDIEPDISLIGTESVVISNGLKYSDQGVKASYRGIDISDHMQVRTNLDVYTKGVYSYEYYIILSDTEYSISREVEVLKDLGVDFNLLGSDMITVEYGTVYTDPGATAIDNKTGVDISYLVTTKNEVNTRVPGTYLVYYHFYYNGLRRTATREVIVEEYNDYVFELSATDFSTEEEIEVFGRAEANRFKAEDGIVAHDRSTNKSIKGFVTIESNFLYDTPGTYTIVYTLNYNGIERVLTKTMIVEWVI